MSRSERKAMIFDKKCELGKNLVAGFMVNLFLEIWIKEIEALMSLLTCLNGKISIVFHIGESSDMATTLEIESLEKKADELVLTYSQTDGEKQSFSTRPFLLLIVDNGHQGELKVVKE